MYYDSYNSKLLNKRISDSNGCSNLNQTQSILFINKDIIYLYLFTYRIGKLCIRLISTYNKIRLKNIKLKIKTIFKYIYRFPTGRPDQNDPTLKS
jgi:hypothetical protein